MRIVLLLSQWWAARSVAHGFEMWEGDEQARGRSTAGPRWLATHLFPEAARRSQPPDAAVGDNTPSVAWWSTSSDALPQAITSGGPAVAGTQRA